MKKEFKIFKKDIKTKPKLELNMQNIPKYIIQEKIRARLPFKKVKIISVEEVLTGFCNVNFVFEVKIKTKKGEKKIYIKQSRPYVKINPQMAFDPKRNYYEYRSIQLLTKILGPKIVPRVFYYDKENFTMVMEDLRRKGEVLAIELKKGIVRPQIGKRFGKIVGTLHGRTFGKNIVIRNKKEDKEMLEFNYDFRTAGAKKIIDVDVQKIVGESKKAKKALIISDLASKNIFVENSQVRLYDFEGVHMGDPAWDVGFILGHFMLEASHRPEIEEKVSRLIGDFMKNYRREMIKYGISQKELRGIEGRATKFMGTAMLHRIFGGVKKGKKVYKEYIPEEKLKGIKNTAIVLIKGLYLKPQEAILALREHN